MQQDNAKEYVQEEEVKEENNQQEHFDVGSNGIEEPQQNVEQTVTTEQYQYTADDHQNERQTRTQTNTVQIQDGQSRVHYYVSASEPSVLETQFKADTKQHLLKCFNEDLGFSKIARSFRREFKEIKDVLQKQFHMLNAIFLFYAGQSHTYPSIAIEDFSNFTEECNLVQNGLITEVALRKCFTETIVSTNNFKQSGEKSLCRYEFLEILVRIAAAISSDRNKGSG